MFPKEERGIVNWFNKGLASNIDKEKALRFIKALPNHTGTITKEELLSATKEVKNFENSKSSDFGRMSAKARETAEKLHLDNVEFVTDTSVPWLNIVNSVKDVYTHRQFMGFMFNFEC